MSDVEVGGGEEAEEQDEGEKDDDECDIRSSDPRRKMKLTMAMTRLYKPLPALYARLVFGSAPYAAESGCAGSPE